MKKVLGSIVVLWLAMVGPETRAGEAGEPMVLQWAILQGARDVSLAVDRLATSDEAGRELLEWDFRRDDEELIELFQLASITTLQQGKNRFTDGGGPVSIQAGEDDEKVDVEISLSIQSMEHQGEDLEVARAAFVIRRGGEVIAAPVIVTKLGDRAIVTSHLPEEESLLYLVLQVDPAG